MSALVLFSQLARRFRPSENKRTPANWGPLLSTSVTCRGRNSLLPRVIRTTPSAVLGLRLFDDAIGRVGRASPLLVLGPSTSRVEAVVCPLCHLAQHADPLLNVLPRPARHRALWAFFIVSPIRDDLRKPLQTRGFCRCDARDGTRYAYRVSGTLRFGGIPQECRLADHEKCRQRDQQDDQAKESGDFHLFPSFPKRVL